VNARQLVVVSGLPASGKTTIGHALSRGLSLPLLDKDDILEALFDSLGSEQQGERHRLSRASDEVLLTLAAASGGAVLVNWWDHDTSPPRLHEVGDTLVEVFCDCPLDVAADTFQARERHPGHLDRLRTAAEHEQGIRTLDDSYRGPLALGGALITVDTSRPVDIEALVDEVRAALPARDATQVIAAALERASALAAGDAERLSALLHADFRWTTHAGETLTRSEYVDRNTTGHTVWRSQDLTDAVVDVVGATAVLHAVVTDVVLTEAGQPETFRMPVTQVWVRTDDRWTCLAGHAGPRLT
jgi:adenylylsulfate kinase-like enzyme/ketosteroid isomerase-like protein